MIILLLLNLLNINLKISHTENMYLLQLNKVGH